MSAQNLLDFFEELIKSPEKTKDIESISKKSIALFNEIVDRLKNSTPRERDKLQKELSAVAEKMTQGFETICTKYGMTREQMENMLNNSYNFDPDTWSSIESLKKEINRRQQSLVQELGSFESAPEEASISTPEMVSTSSTSKKTSTSEKERKKDIKKGKKSKKWINI